MLQGCPNGARERGVPVTPAQVAADAAAMVAAGVEELHIHPKDSSGGDTLDPLRVAEFVAAVRVTAPGIPLGVTTGAWAEPDPQRRIALVRAWDPGAVPDYASVNFHEDGAVELAKALLDKGIGIEAGLFSGTSGADVLALSGIAERMHRLLAEVLQTDPLLTVAAARDHFTRLGPLARIVGRPVLLHGEGLAAWPVLRLAHELGADTRIGLEDVLVDPDGRQASNASLVRSARDIIRRPRA
jgi:uncharacterized protein (DUF849 family)